MRRTKRGGVAHRNEDGAAFWVLPSNFHGTPFAPRLNPRLSRSTIYKFEPNRILSCLQQIKLGLIFSFAVAKCGWNPIFETANAALLRKGSATGERGTRIENALHDEERSP